LLSEIVVVDFNPRVYERLQQRGVAVAYGDITQRETLLHAGVTGSEIIICSLPNTVLKGADNLKMLRQLRELNSHAQIIVHAELLEDIPKLYAAGASYVSTPRLLEAADLLNVIDAVENKLLDEKRTEQARLLKDRNEVIP
jgi:voltage-gated potassium channel Kch